jgi:hypothetical protein
MIINMDYVFLTVLTVVMVTFVCSFWVVVPSRQERRNNHLRLKIEEARLRDELLAIEGREDESMNRKHR